MPLNIDLTKKLVTKTDRVKQICFHPTENWVAVALYTGSLLIYDYVSGGTVKIFQVSEHPLRCCRFIPSRKLVLCAGDDLKLRAYHYGNGKLVHEGEAHSDYIRSVAVCPNDRYVITSSDDSNVKLWDAENGFQLKTTYEGHTHYVMQVAWHPNGEVFASASLDKTVRIWGVTHAPLVNQPNLVLKGHTKSVNCVAFGPEQSNIIVSGGDDFIAVWDIHTKQLLHKLEGHTAPINAVAFHPVFPLILSGGEDNHVRLWNTNTYKKEDVMQFHMNRIWSLDAKGDGSCLIGIGADNGCAVVEMGKSRMIYSYHGGKLMFCKQNRVYVSNLRTVTRAENEPIEDGAIVEVGQKELGSTDMFAQSVIHHPNGRLVAVCGENEFLIYTSQALRSKAFGTAQSFAWSSDGDYATLNDKNVASRCKIQLFKDFKESVSLSPGSAVENLFGGRYLGVVVNDTGCFAFHDWNTGALIRSLDVPNVRDVVWSQGGDIVAVVSEDGTYILAINEEGFSGEYDPEEGYIDAFEKVAEINDDVTSLVWVHSADSQDPGSLAYLTATNKLNLWIHGHHETLGFTGTPLTLVGYNDQDEALILIDRQYNISYYSCNQAWIQYHLLILQQDFPAADAIFEKVPERYHNKIAKFLDSEGHREKALDVTKDDEHRLTLALSLNNLGYAAKVLEGVKMKDPNSVTLQQQWRSLGDAALSSGSIDLAGSCFMEAKDYTSALLIYSSTGDRAAMERLAEQAARDGQVEVAVYTYIHLNADPKKVMDLYLNNGHPAQAALFARTYAPHLISECLGAWEKQLGSRFKVELPEAASLVAPEDLKDPSPVGVTTETTSPRGSSIPSSPRAPAPSGDLLSGVSAPSLPQGTETVDSTSIEEEVFEDVEETEDVQNIERDENTSNAAGAMSPCNDTVEGRPSSEMPRKMD